ncbi:PIG-L family deacetylase [Rugosimonospora acidiphila]|uniref:PIG-L family deacetylase n=1 Tax=Rugosimonospora acidiphila TaxID=556531 RepID=A0ABP9RIJ2_9ACTN
MSFPPSVKPISDAQRVLVVSAHPDDADFGAAGTVARWVEQGLEVVYLLVTRGDAGGFDETPRDQMPLLREAEQLAAAKAVGVEQVEFLDGYSDGRLEPTIALRRDITRVIRAVRPDRILTNSPLRRWDRIAGPSHPDHLAVGEATTCAIYPDSRNPFAFPELLDDEGLQPWVVREVWYQGGPSPDLFVDVTATYPQKIAALLAHVTQTSHEDVESRVRAMLAANAAAAGLPDGRLAEAFTVLSTQ